MKRREFIHRFAKDGVLAGVVGVSVGFSVGVVGVSVLLLL